MPGLAVWDDYSKPAAAGDFPLRDKLTFYGLSDGPLLNPEQAPELYVEFSRSPFVSLYGSRNWAEDFAELVTFWMITRQLRQPYMITVTVPGGEPLVIKPMDSQKNLDRAGSMMKILESL
ncbi:MAG: hypothetical protein WCW52_09420 [Elusimicrobiales bacterium]